MKGPRVLGHHPCLCKLRGRRGQVVCRNSKGEAGLGWGLTWSSFRGNLLDTFSSLMPMFWFRVSRKFETSPRFLSLSLGRADSIIAHWGWVGEGKNRVCLVTSAPRQKLNGFSWYILIPAFSGLKGPRLSLCPFYPPPSPPPNSCFFYKIYWLSF